MFNATEKSSKIRTGLANYSVLGYSFQVRKILLVKEREGGREETGGKKEGMKERENKGKEREREEERKGNDF